MNLPIGSIILWVGEGGGFPAGWQLCDGTNGTPNLSNRFPLGAAVDGDLLVTGGVETHVHSLGTTGSRAAHAHTGFSGSSGGTGSNSNVLGNSGRAAAMAGHSHALSMGVWDGDEHSHTVGATVSHGNTLPPYKKVYYLMRMVD